MFVEGSHNDLFISYYGPFSMRIISNIGKHLTENLDASEIVKMKLYRVLIELSQNVARYSSERQVLSDGSKVGIGTVHIQNCNSYLKCTTVNIILDQQQNVLIGNCQEINNSTEEELRKRKVILRKESTLSDRGAHIGLISVFLYSENHFEFEIINRPENKTKYFSITATINNA